MLFNVRMAIQAMLHEEAERVATDWDGPPPVRLELLAPDPDGMKNPVRRSTMPGRKTENM